MPSRISCRRWLAESTGRTCSYAFAPKPLLMTMTLHDAGHTYSPEYVSRSLDPRRGQRAYGLLGRRRPRVTSGHDCSARIREPNAPGDCTVVQPLVRDEGCGRRGDVPGCGAGGNAIRDADSSSLRRRRRDGALADPADGRRPPHARIAPRRRRALAHPQRARASRSRAAALGEPRPRHDQKPGDRASSSSSRANGKFAPRAGCSRRTMPAPQRRPCSTSARQPRGARSRRTRSLSGCAPGRMPGRRHRRARTRRLRDRLSAARTILFSGPDRQRGVPGLVHPDARQADPRGTGLRHAPRAGLSAVCATPAAPFARRRRASRRDRALRRGARRRSSASRCGGQSPTIVRWPSPNATRSRSVLRRTVSCGNSICRTWLARQPRDRCSCSIPFGAWARRPARLRGDLYKGVPNATVRTLQTGEDPIEVLAAWAVASGPAAGRPHAAPLDRQPCGDHPSSARISSPACFSQDRARARHRRHSTGRTSGTRRHQVLMPGEELEDVFARTHSVP